MIIGRPSEFAGPWWRRLDFGGSLGLLVGGPRHREARDKRGLVRGARSSAREPHSHTTASYRQLSGRCLRVCLSVCLSVWGASVGQRERARERKRESFSGEPEGQSSLSFGEGPLMRSAGLR